MAFPAKLEKLAQWLATQSEQVKASFMDTLPSRTSDWFTMSWRSDAFKAPAPNLTLATSEVRSGVGSDSHPIEVEATIKSPQDFRNLIVMWSNVRKFYPPVWAGHPIYRLTGVPALPQGSPVVYSNKSQRKAATSWTVNSKPYVAGRSHTQPYDIVLEYKTQGSKHILFDFASVIELCKDIEKNWEEFRIKGRLPYSAGSKNPVYWTSLRHSAEPYEKEHEVVLYLNDGEEIHCNWKKVWQSNKARDDGGGWAPGAPKFGGGGGSVGVHAPGYEPEDQTTPKEKAAQQKALDIIRKGTLGFNSLGGPYDRYFTYTDKNEGHFISVTPLSGAKVAVKVPTGSLLCFEDPEFASPRYNVAVKPPGGTWTTYLLNMGPELIDGWNAAHYMSPYKPGPGASTSKTPTPNQEPKVQPGTKPPVKPAAGSSFAAIPDLVYNYPADGAAKFKVPQPVVDHWEAKYGSKLQDYKWFRNGEGVFKFSDGFTVTKGAIVGIKPQPVGTTTTTLIRNKNGEQHYVKVDEAQKLIKQCKYRK